MAGPVIQKDTLTKHQLVLHKYLKFASSVNGMFNGNEFNPGEFSNARVIAVPDIKVDDYIVDADIARVGANHYQGSQYTDEWKNGIPPVEWRYYSMSRHRSFGYTVWDEQEKLSAIKNLPQEYLARKMQTTVIRDHDKYLLLAIILGRMTGKLVPRTSADAVNSVVETNTGQSAARISCTGNQADYRWIAQPGENSDNEIQPSFATIQGMELDSQDPLKTLDALTTMFGENWFDTNYANSERFMLITPALELVFRDQLVKAGTYVDGGFDVYKNADNSGVTGATFFGQLRGWKFMKIHPEFLPKVFVTATNVIDPSPVLTAPGVATNRTLKQVVALAAYKGSAMTYDYFNDKKSQEGGVRGDFTEYVQKFGYDAWVIDQKSEGIVPIFLPSDLDGNGTTDANYTPVNDQFNRIADAVAKARSNKSTIATPNAPRGLSYYPISGPDVNPARPGWYEQPYNNTTAINESLQVKDAGDNSHSHFHDGIRINPIDDELQEVVEIVAASVTARADSTAVTVGQKRKFAGDRVGEVITAGTTGATAPVTTGWDVDETLTDGTAVFKRIL